MRPEERCIICDERRGTILTIDGLVCERCMPREILPSAGPLGRHNIISYRRTMSFTPDVEGAAVCSDGKIELPRLAQLVPFSGEIEYDTAVRNGNEIIVSLQ